MTWRLLIGVSTGVLVSMASPWLLALVARRWGTDDIQIAPPVQKFVGLDEGARLLSNARRHQVERLRRESARVASSELNTPSKVTSIGGRRVS